jgi:hypothetical protein
MIFHRNFILTHRARLHNAGMLMTSTLRPLFAAPAGEPIATSCPPLGARCPEFGDIHEAAKGGKPATHSRREAACPSAGVAGPMDGDGGMIRRRLFTRRDGGISHRRTKPCVT